MGTRQVCVMESFYILRYSYTTICICQNLYNSIIKMMKFTVSTLYLIIKMRGKKWGGCGHSRDKNTQCT